MINFKFAVCDDDEIALSAVAGTLNNGFAKEGIVIKVDTFFPSKKIEEKIIAGNYNAVFLDINMPETDGIELGKKLKSACDNLDIIYVSSEEDRVFESFSVHPYGFIRKSNFIKDISDLIKRYIDSKRIERNSTLEIRDHVSIENIDASQIVYIESIRDCQYLYIYKKSNPTKIRLSMFALEEQLSPYGFLRINKGYLVNFRFIRRIDSGEVLLTTEVSLPISRRKLQDIRRRYLELNRKIGTPYLKSENKT